MEIGLLSESERARHGGGPFPVAFRERGGGRSAPSHALASYGDVQTIAISVPVPGWPGFGS